MNISNSNLLLSKIADIAGVPFTSGELQGIDMFLPFLKKIQMEGAVIVIKFDGERKEDEDPVFYTIIISGSRLISGPCRVDSRTLEEGLTQIIIDYAKKYWRFDDH